MDLETKRLRLRCWQDSDRSAFAEMSSDPDVMKYLGGVWNRETSDTFINHANQHFAQYGYGMCALELKETGRFIGFTGLKNVPFKTHFTPAIEIGWRLSKNYWNNGYATEAAQKILEYAFDSLKLEEIVSYATPANNPSIKVMEKLRMRCNENGQFKHPWMPIEAPFSEMVLYRLKRTDYEA